MSFQDTLRKTLTPELYTSVIDSLGDDFDFDLVPRSRLNQVIKQRNKLREQLAGGSQPQDTGDEGDEGDGGGVDIEKLQKQWKAQSDQAIQEVKIQYAALDSLRAANVIDPELVWSSSLIDKKALKLDESGALTGLDSQLENFKKSKSHLFKPTKPEAEQGTGKDSGDDGSTVTTKEEFLKLDIDKQIAFKKANPEVFKTFMA